MAKLTKPQVGRLQIIADFVPNANWPHAAFWKESRTDMSLVKRGLVERINHTTTLRGGMTATWHLCKLTESGRLALQESHPNEHR